MPCDVRRGESPWDTSWATNPEAGSYQNSEVPPGAGSPTCWGSNGIGQDTLQGASVAPVGGAAHLCVHMVSTSLEAPPDDIPAPVRFPAS